MATKSKSRVRLLAQSTCPGDSAKADSLENLFHRLSLITTAEHWAINRTPFGVQMVVIDGRKGHVYETGPDLVWVLGQVLEKLA